MPRLLVATQNPHKIKEYREILAEFADIEWVSLDDVGLGDMEVAETGSTFAENAELKARAYGEAAGLITFADDSGLVVDALNGAPGVYSARYGGEALKSDVERYEFLLKNLAGESNRAARFVCVIAVYLPGQPIHFSTGKVEGRIIDTPRGGNGFGYDPVFELQHAKTMAELLPAEKHSLSHRGLALQAALPFLRKVL